MLRYVKVRTASGSIHYTRTFVYMMRVIVHIVRRWTCQIYVPNIRSNSVSPRSPPAHQEQSSTSMPCPLSTHTLDQFSMLGFSLDPKGTDDPPAPAADPGGRSSQIKTYVSSEAEARYRPPWLHRTQSTLPVCCGRTARTFTSSPCTWGDDLVGAVLEEPGVAARAAPAAVVSAADE